jgi:hypothetical protein
VRENRVKRRKRRQAKKRNSGGIDIVGKLQQISLAEFAKQDLELLRDGTKDPYQKCLARQKDSLREINDLIEFEKTREARKAELSDLDSKVDQGFLNGLRELAFIAHESAQLLDQWTLNHPQYVKLVAGEYPTWPLLCDDSVNRAAEKIKQFKAIGLDSCRPLTASATHIGGYSSAPRRWALKLLQQIDGSRRFAIRKGRPRPHGLWRIVGSSEWPAIPDDDEDHEYGDIRSAAARLPDLSKASVSQWWKVAKQLLLRVTNDEPWEEKDLAPYANTKRATDAQDAGSSSGVKRSEILKAVEQAFRRLAKTAYDTPSPRKRTK